MKPHYRSRYDYLLIWGHGLIHQDAIISILEQTSEIELLKIFKHIPTSIQTLVDEIYSHDYAPIAHLRGKVKYLLSTPANVVFIFFKNNDTRIDYYGEGAYRHEESILIRELKEKIRNNYNPKNTDGTRTENHVIHASDSSEQTSYALKYLGISDGIKFLSDRRHFLGIPSHISKNSKYKSQLIDIDKITVSINVGSSNRSVSIEETPHYLALKNDFSIYHKYLSEYLGTKLIDFYSVRRFEQLANTLPSPALTDLPIVKKINSIWMLQDGLHRIAIFKSRGIKKIPVLVVE